MKYCYSKLDAIYATLESSHPFAFEDFGLNTQCTVALDHDNSTATNVSTCA